MSRVIAVVAMGFTLAACSSSWMSFEMPKPAPAGATLRLESEPPGAEARVAGGPSCRTPCEVAVAVSGDTSVTFNLTGYAPQTIAVQMQPPGDPRFGEPQDARLSPNPVFAELDPASAPPRRSTPAKGPAKAPAKKKAAPKAAPAAAPAAQPAPAQSSSPFPPPPASAFPPPPQR